MSKNVKKGLNAGQLAESIGKSRQTIHNWLAEGLPRNPDKTFSLPDVISWLLDRETALLPPAGQGCDSPALERYRQARAELAELDLAQKRGELISIADVGREWTARVVEVASGLDAFADRLPPLLEDKPREAMRQIIDDEVWRLRDMYYHTGRFCEPPPGLIKLIDNFFAERKASDD